MKRGVIIFIFILVFLANLATGATRDPYDLPVKKIYSSPTQDSQLIYNIPIEVKLLDISEDGNWYKVKISFNLGPLSYTYVGWAEIPVGEILASRTKLAKIPQKELTNQ